MNVLFLCVDCLRQDFVVSDRADTPFLDELVSDGVYFSNMYSTTTTTTPCVASFLTGCYSEKNGVNSHSYSELDDDVETLAEILSENGYSTYAMTTGPLVTETSLDRGFDSYWYRDRNKNLAGKWGTTAREKLSRLEDPFFLYMHLWELHWPIEVPSEYDSAAYGNSPFARALSALDRELESFVAELPENTMIVFHGDHGESITGRGIPWAIPRYVYRRFVREKLTYERGYDTRRLTRVINRIADTISRPDIRDHYLETGHGTDIYDFTTNVPFLVCAPDLDPATVDNQVRQIDIFPTVLNAIGIEYDPTEDIDGESLLPPTAVEDRDAYMRATGGDNRGGRGNSWMRGIRTNGYKYIEYPSRDWSPELYDLDSDPSELSPIQDEELEAELENKLPNQELMDVEKSDVDDLLRDLGYL